MDPSLDEVPAQKISLKRPENSNIPLRLLYADLKNKRRARFASDETVKTKISKTNDSELQQKRLIRFSEKQTVENVSKTKTSNDTLKQREIRFSENSSKNTVKMSNEDLIESLKKRRERFGEVTSTLLKKIEVKEKVLQRKARFGQNGVETSQTNGSANKTQKKKIVF